MKGRHHLDLSLHMAKKLFTLSALTLSLLPAVTLAQLDIPTPEPVNISSVDQLIDILGNVANIIFVVLFTVAVIFILMAAFYYLTAAGDPAKVTLAHNRLIYAGVAIAVGLLAQAIVLIVRSLLT